MAFNSALWLFKKDLSKDFPGGAAVTNPPVKAEDTDLIPGPGGSHMLQGNWVPLPQLLNPMCLEPCAATDEAIATSSPRIAAKSSPHLLQLETSGAQLRRSSTAKNKS